MEQILQLPLNAEDFQIIHSIEQQFSKKEVVIGFFGSFSVGKSELINRLISRGNLLPTHTNETTALPTIITGGTEEHMSAILENNEEVSLDREQFHSLIAGSKIEGFKEIHIQLAKPDWLKKISFIDTPGRNTKIQSHIDASEAALFRTDAVLYVMPWQGLTIEDIVYIKKILLYQPNLSFVINKVDRIDETEGVSIEQLQEKIAIDLENQLGKRYPVFAVSAKTGFNIQKLLDGYIQQVANNVEQIKKDRFDYAVSQFLQRQKILIQNEISFLQLALKEDGLSIDDEKRRIELQYKQAGNQITEELQKIKIDLYSQERGMEKILVEEIELLQKQLENFLEQHGNYSINQLQVHMESILMDSRQNIFSSLSVHLQKILSKDLNFTLNQIEGEYSLLKYTELSYEELSMQYEKRKIKLIDQFEKKSEQLKRLPIAGSEEKRISLENELEQLICQTTEQFIPQLIIDTSFDSKKAEKIARGVGFVGDIALAVGLAVATAGTSAAVQVGGKVAAKEAAKQTAKKATKEIMWKAGKQKLQQELVEKGLKVAVEALGSAEKTSEVLNPSIPLNELNKMKKGEQSPLLAAVKTLDAVTSPVETIAVKIGQTIDRNREEEITEDIEHRVQFFAKKYEVETRYEEKVAELRKFEEQAQENELLRVQLEEKSRKLQIDKQEQVLKIEQEQKEAIQQQKQLQLKKYISNEIMKILEEEKKCYSQWFKIEFQRIYQTVETMLPEHYYGELHIHEENLASLKKGNVTNVNDVHKKMEELEKHLETCVSILNSLDEN